MAKILIVEDEQALNDAYRLILEHDGHTVICAFDGQQALEAVAKSEPDLILLDLRMPRMSGIEFLQAFDVSNSKTKIIIFSNLDEQNEVNMAYQLGADKYILKAWASPKELTKVVRDILKTSRPKAAAKSRTKATSKS